MNMSAENMLFSMAKIILSPTTVRLEENDKLHRTLVIQQQDMTTGYRYTFLYVLRTIKLRSVFQYRQWIRTAQKTIKNTDRNSQKKNAAKLQNSVIP
jgi:hypothetical protein